MIFLFLGRMNNIAQSVDVVKDCFGMTEVRKSKSFYNSISTENTTNINFLDEEYHW